MTDAKKQNKQNKQGKSKDILYPDYAEMKDERFHMIMQNENMTGNDRFSPPVLKNIALATSMQNFLSVTKNWLIKEITSTFHHNL